MNRWIFIRKHDFYIHCKDQGFHCNKPNPTIDMVFTPWIWMIWLCLLWESMVQIVALAKSLWPRWLGKSTTRVPNGFMLSICILLGCHNQSDNLFTQNFRNPTSGLISYSLNFTSFIAAIKLLSCFNQFAWKKRQEERFRSFFLTCFFAWPTFNGHLIWETRWLGRCPRPLAVVNLDEVKKCSRIEKKPEYFFSLDMSNSMPIVLCVSNHL